MGHVIWPKQIAFFTSLGVQNISLGRRHALAWSIRPPLKAKLKGATELLRLKEARLWTEWVRKEMWKSSDLSETVEESGIPGTKVRAFGT